MVFSTVTRVFNHEIADSAFTINQPRVVLLHYWWHFFTRKGQTNLGLFYVYMSWCSLADYYQMLKWRSQIQIMLHRALSFIAAVTIGARKSMASFLFPQIGSKLTVLPGQKILLAPPPPPPPITNHEELSPPPPFGFPSPLFSFLFFTCWNVYKGPPPASG